LSDAIQQSPDVMARPEPEGRIYRPATPPNVPGHPGHGYRVDEIDAMRIERDVAVPMRDGIEMFVDVYTPLTASAPVPLIIGWSPYGKHNRGYQALFAEGHDVHPAWISDHCAFEAPDPAYWCAHGYAVVYADPRGSWFSPGDWHHADQFEADDVYDAIEWLAAQEWCSGKVGMSGVSYLAHVQYLAAARRPPHLAAINPCEAFVDMYRDFAYRGGIPERRFIEMISGHTGHGLGRVENIAASADSNPLRNSEYWVSKQIDLTQIDVPAFLIAGWADQGLHARGPLEAFEAIGSAQKWLEVHGRKKWHYYYRPDIVERTRCFFDCHLKGEGPGLEDRAPVTIEVRERVGAGITRAEHSWPLKRAEHSVLHLDTASGMLTTEAPSTAASVRYDALTGSTSFTHAFAQDTELTGAMRLRLWVETDVPQTFFAVFEDGPVALGWLRASHRELDEQSSTPEVPRHRHDREQRLSPGERVSIDVAIWPSSTAFAHGEGLRLIVQGHDIYAHYPDVPEAAWLRHRTRNAGAHVIHAGGDYDSYLVVPVVR
jgi:predicted acyl esterase